MDIQKEFFRRFPKQERDHIVLNVVTALRGVHESIDCVREDVRELENELDNVLYGKSFGDTLNDLREEACAEKAA